MCSLIDNYIYRVMGRGFFLKKFTVVYIQNDLTLRYTVQTLNLFYSLIFQCEINPLFFLLKILNIFNAHTEKGENVFFKETYKGVYPKEPNSPLPVYVC